MTEEQTILQLESTIPKTSMDIYNPNTQDIEVKSTDYYL